MSQRESIGRSYTRTQSTSGPPVTDMVKVAVLPPRLPSEIAPPSGIGAADAFNWDESLNWRHNQPIEQPEASRRKSLFRKAGLTTQRQPRNPDTPPFTFRYVPYDVWRKHYAKDKDGNYKGTHAPAEDCLLKPDDVKKWNFGEARTLADKWTRGREALPVYAEVHEQGLVPEYEVDYDGPPRDGGPPTEERVFTAEDESIAARLERKDTAAYERREQGPILEEYSDSHEARQGSQATTNSTQEWASGQTIDGKTSQQIIAEAKARGSMKTGWKGLVKKGFEMASMGA